MDDPFSAKILPKFIFFVVIYGINVRHIWLWAINDIPLFLELL